MYHKSTSSFIMTSWLRDFLNDVILDEKCPAEQVLGGNLFKIRFRFPDYIFPSFPEFLSANSKQV
jgi:hypothetical protein